MTKVHPGNASVYWQGNHEWNQRSYGMSCSIYLQGFYCEGISKGVQSNSNSGNTEARK